MLPSAIHRHQPWQSNCSQMSQILRPTCMQWSQLSLSNVRIRQVARRVRAAAAAAAAAAADGPGATQVELVDSFAITGDRLRPAVSAPSSRRSHASCLMCTTHDARQHALRFPGETNRVNNGKVEGEGGW